MTDVNTLGDAPIEDAYRTEMNLLAKALDDVLNPGQEGAQRTTAFVLLCFPYGDKEGGRCNFISNGANREDIVVLFKEMIARFEGQPEVTGHG